MQFPGVKVGEGLALPDPRPYGLTLKLKIAFGSHLVDRDLSAHWQERWPGLAGFCNVYFWGKESRKLLYENRSYFMIEGFTANSGEKYCFYNKENNYQIAFLSGLLTDHKKHLVVSSEFRKSVVSLWRRKSSSWILRNPWVTICGCCRKSGNILEYHDKNCWSKLTLFCGHSIILISVTFQIRGIHFSGLFLYHNLVPPFKELVHSVSRIVI